MRSGCRGVGAVVRHSYENTVGSFEMDAPKSNFCFGNGVVPNESGPRVCGGCQSGESL